jgi:hypothetical protein
MSDLRWKRLLASKREKLNSLNNFINSLELDITRKKGIPVYEDRDILISDIRRIERFLAKQMSKTQS